MSKNHSQCVDTDKKNDTLNGPGEGFPKRFLHFAEEDLLFFFHKILLYEKKKNQRPFCHPIAQMLLLFSSLIS